MRRGAVLLVAALALGSCSSVGDITLANRCPHPVAVEIATGPSTGVAMVFPGEGAVVGTYFAGDDVTVSSVAGATFAYEQLEAPASGIDLDLSGDSCTRSTRTGTWIGHDLDTEVTVVILTGTATAPTTRFATQFEDDGITVLTTPDPEGSVWRSTSDVDAYCYATIDSTAFTLDSCRTTPFP